MGLEMVEITLQVERQFSIELPHRRVVECRTYGDFLDLVVDVVCKSNPVSSELEIDTFLRELLVSEYSIKAEFVTRDAELYGPKLNLG